MGIPQEQVVLSQKQSGRYILGQSQAWKVIAICKTPKKLFEEVQKLGMVTVIKAEYSQSQLKTLGSQFTKQEALKAFNISATKSNIEIYFGEHGVK